MAANDRHTHHNGEIRLVRTDGIELEEDLGGQVGAAAYWQDGSTSYLLHTRTGHTHGFSLADEMDTVIQFVDRIRLDEDIEPGSMAKALEDIRRLRNRLEAIESEAILVARENVNGAEGHVRSRKPRMTFEAISTELGLDHSTVVERHRKLIDGKHASWRRWLVQGTFRASMYNDSADV